MVHRAIRALVEDQGLDEALTGGVSAATQVCVMALEAERGVGGGKVQGSVERSGAVGGGVQERWH